MAPYSLSLNFVPDLNPTEAFVFGKNSDKTITQKSIYSKRQMILHDEMNSNYIPDLNHYNNKYKLFNEILS